MAHVSCLWCTCNHESALHPCNPMNKGIRTKQSRNSGRAGSLELRVEPDTEKYAGTVELFCSPYLPLRWTEVALDNSSIIGASLLPSLFHTANFCARSSDGCYSSLSSSKLRLFKTNTPGTLTCLRSLRFLVPLPRKHPFLAKPS